MTGLPTTPALEGVFPATACDKPDKTLATVRVCVSTQFCELESAAKIEEKILEEASFSSLERLAGLSESKPSKLLSDDAKLSDTTVIRNSALPSHTHNITNFRHNPEALFLNTRPLTSVPTVTPNPHTTLNFPPVQYQHSDGDFSRNPPPSMAQQHTSVEEILQRGKLLMQKMAAATTTNHASDTRIRL